MDLTKKILIGIGILIIILAFVGLVLGKSKISKPQNNTSDTTAKTFPPATDDSPAFVGTLWSANSIENSELISESSITVQFDNQGRVTGSDGCNTFNSSYELNGSEIIISPNMISTKKACEENIMKQADAFIKILLASTSYKLGDGVMMLLQGEKEGLSFTGSTNAFAKTSWNVTGYNNGNEAVVSPILDTNPTITFGDDGTISGNAGCNTFSGTYNLDGKSISFGTLAVTQRECIEPEGIMEQESSLLTYLEKADTWLIQGDILYLRTAEDQLAVVGTSGSTNPSQ